MGMSGQLNVLPTLYTRKEPLIPIEEEAGWSSVLVWTLWRKEKSVTLTME
jgi:hypothetical protein